MSVPTPLLLMAFFLFCSSDFSTPEAIFGQDEIPSSCCSAAPPQLLPQSLPNLKPVLPILLPWDSLRSSGGRGFMAASLSLKLCPSGCLSSPFQFFFCSPSSFISSLFFPMILLQESPERGPVIVFGGFCVGRCCALCSPPQLYIDKTLLS